ncbi:MAG: HD domain-containing protein [Candidatus Omnitrophica bacterium]|nr:HD domain-containing protein [Candidatus Omnitrophota bacterium]
MKKFKSSFLKKLNRKKKLNSLRKYKTLLSSTHSIYRLINSTSELKELVVRLARLLCQIFDAEHCVIILLDPSKKYSVLKCSIDGKGRHIIDKRMPVSNRIEKNIIGTATSVRRADILGLPLICEDIIGEVVMRRSSRARAFDRFDQEILTSISEYIIMGIRNCQLMEEQQKIILGSIKSLLTLMDKRIPQEYTHSSYFHRLVTMIAREMKLEEKQIECLKFASLLHDTGKADIPLQILTKASKLTQKEFDIIKKHPASGAEILKHIQVLKPAIPIILYHHEKYDGTGYPSRLKKKQIPLGARIMAIADAFDAMVYGRPYRERIDIDSAIKEIKNKSGSQFDPRIVEVFLKIAKKIRSKKYLRYHK